MHHRLLPMACLMLSACLLASCASQRSKAKPAAEAQARGEKSLAAGNTARFASLLRAEGYPEPEIAAMVRGIVTPAAPA